MRQFPIRSNTQNLVHGVWKSQMVEVLSYRSTVFACSRPDLCAMASGGRPWARASTSRDQNERDTSIVDAQHSATNNEGRVHADGQGGMSHLRLPRCHKSPQKLQGLGAVGERANTSGHHHPEVFPAVQVYQTRPPDSRIRNQETGGSNYCFFYSYSCSTQKLS